MFVVYGKEDCPWCDRAKDLLIDKGVDYRYHDVTVSTSALHGMIINFPGRKTVPAIMKVDGPTTMIIGGYEDLVDYFKSN